MVGWAGPRCSNPDFTHPSTHRHTCQTTNSYDYEGVEKVGAEAMFAAMVQGFPSAPGTTMDGYTVAVADEFEYVDPVDGSVSSNQGE